MLAFKPMLTLHGQKEAGSLRTRWNGGECFFLKKLFFLLVVVSDDTLCKVGKLVTVGGERRLCESSL